jgi:hypothetical protein
VWELDLQKDIWNKLGTGIEQTFYIIGYSPWGLLCNNHTNRVVQLLDLRTNQLLPLKEEYYKIFYEKYTSCSPDVAFFSDSTLLFGNYKNDVLDSIVLKRTAFESTGSKFYNLDTNIKSSSLKQIKPTLLFLLAAMLGLLGYWLYNKRKAQQPQIDSQSNPIKISLQNHFSPIEIELLNLLLKKANLQQFAEVEELNKILGITAKNDSIQKKIRSESIQNINKTIRLLSGMDEDAILKRRSDNDKRMFVYFLNEKYTELLMKLL